MDISALATMLGLSHLLQVVGLSVQYVVNRTYRGIGWWLLWSASVAAGSAFAVLRHHPELRLLSIVAQNWLIVLGVTFLYVGLMRFYSRRVNRPFVATVIPSYLAAHAYFTLVSDDIWVRSVLVNVALAAISLFTAWELRSARTRGTSTSANFLCGVLLLHGLFFLSRSAVILAGARVTDFFSATPLNIAPLLDGFVVGNLLAVGLIILINQRSYTEMVEARDHFELLFHTSPEAVLITRVEDGVCLDVNQGFEALSGYSRSEALGHAMTDLDIYRSPADRQGIVEALKEKGSVSSVQVPFRRKDGTTFVGSLSARVFSLRGVPHVMSVTRDVTEQRRAEEAREESARQIQEWNVRLERRVADRTAELRDANRELEALVYSIAHDLRAPLRAVDGFSGLLERELAGRLEGDGVRLLGRVRRGAQRADRLIRDLIQYAGIGTVPMRPAPVEMGALARRAFDEVAVEEVRRTFRFTVGELPPAVGDPELLGNLFRLLLSNAVKFSLPRPERRIEVSGKREGGWAEYRVEDDGVGFNPEYADKLFGVFQQLEVGAEVEGTGIGLAIAKRIAVRHGGQIRAEGTLNGGAAFTFMLPDPGAGRA